MSTHSGCVGCRVNASSFRKEAARSEGSEQRVLMAGVMISRLLQPQFADVPPVRPGRGPPDKTRPGGASSGRTPGVQGRINGVLGRASGQEAG